MPQQQQMMGAGGMGMMGGMGGMGMPPHQQQQQQMMMGAGGMGMMGGMGMPPQQPPPDDGDDGRHAAATADDDGKQHGDDGDDGRLNNFFRPNCRVLSVKLLLPLLLRSPLASPRRCLWNPALALAAPLRLQLRLLGLPPNPPRRGVLLLLPLLLL